MTAVGALGGRIEAGGEVLGIAKGRYSGVAMTWEGQRERVRVSDIWWKASFAREIGGTGARCGCTERGEWEKRAN